MDDKKMKLFKVLNIVGACAAAAIAFATTLSENKQKDEFELMKERVALLEEKISE